MHERFKRIIHGVTPPILLHAAKVALRPNRDTHAGQPVGGEKGAEWYDASFESNRDWELHYSKSEYYFLWTVIADRIARANARSILEIACGPGQLACLLRDKGIRKYQGFDFSPKRIEQAQRACPEFTFSVQDAFKTDLFASWDYDAVLCTEFLEHVEGDLEILKRVRPGARFYGTVPNFPFTSHVRYFRSQSEVVARYGSCFNDLRVDAFFADGHNKTFYLLEGTTG